jgi:nitrite reductase (NO-forming)
VTSGAVLIAVELPSRNKSLVALGGAAFVCAIAILGWMLWRAWRLSVNRRHTLPLIAYAAAIASALVGVTLGALIGSGAVSGAQYADVRAAHMTLNVLGFASLTVVGTLVTLLPTVLRVRMPRSRPALVLWPLIGGLALMLAGFLLDLRVLLWAGGLVYAAGALGLLTVAVPVLRHERRWRVPAAGLHMFASVAWFIWGSLALAWALARGPEGFAAFRSTFLVAFVGGWLVQVLNAGLILLVLWGAGRARSAVGQLGTVLALTGVGIALAKAWLFPVISLGPVETERARNVWGLQGRE